jgi:hypothetical protein
MYAGLTDLDQRGSIVDAPSWEPNQGLRLDLRLRKGAVPQRPQSMPKR